MKTERNIIHVYVIIKDQYYAHTNQATSIYNTLWKEICIKMQKLKKLVK